MLAWKMENTYLLEAPIQALAGQIFNSNKTGVQGMADARPMCAVPPRVPLPIFYIECMPGVCLGIAIACSAMRLLGIGVGSSK